MTHEHKKPTPGRASPSVTRAGVAIATMFGAGYAPLAPGTVATALTLPLAWLCGQLPGLLRIFFV
jgi:hypothetical protein